MAEITVRVEGNSSGGNSNPPQPTPPQQSANVPPSGGTTPSATPTGGGGGNTYQPNNTPAGGNNGASSSTPGAPQPPVGGSASASTQSTQSVNDRLAADIRREIQSRGVVLVPGTANFSTLMQQIGRQVGDNNSQAISQKYDNLRLDAAHRTRLERDAALNGPQGRAIEDEYQANIANAQTPADIDYYNKQREAAYDRLLSPILKKGQTEVDSINQREAAEKAESEEALAQAMKELTEEFRRGNPNSYMGRLRDQYRTAIYQRDNAESEEDVKRYSKEAQEISKKMSAAQGGGINRLAQLTSAASLPIQFLNRGAQAYDAYWDTQMTHMRALSSASNGDIFGAQLQENAQTRANKIMAGAGIGTIIGGIVGGIIGAVGTWGFGTAAGIAGGAALGGVIGGTGGHIVGSAETKDDDARAVMGQTLRGVEDKLAKFNAYAVMMGGDINTNRAILSHRVDYDNMAMWGGHSDGVNIYDLGMNSAQFAEQIANRSKQRGYLSKSDAERNVFNQIALERAYSLSDGTLAQLSTFDRYSAAGRHQNNANQDAANLVASLQAVGTLGMGTNARDASSVPIRTQEFLGYQNQLMEAQKAWMNPNANYAQRQLVTAQKLFGDNMDSRAIQELGQINGKVQNPGGGYADALVYDVIQELFPDARGNLLKIREYQYSNDPNVNAKIQAAVAKRMEKIYGSVNTTSGYLAMSEFYGIKDPDRLKKWMGAGGIKSGYPGSNVKTGDVSGTVDGMKGYTSPITKELAISSDTTLSKLVDITQTYQDAMTQIVQRIQYDLEEDLKAFRKAMGH